MKGTSSVSPSNILRKRIDYLPMIAITLSEKEAIRKRFPNVHIARTMKQDSRRHHYYMVEDRGPMRYLRELRGYEESESNKPHGGRNHNRGRKGV